MNFKRIGVKRPLVGATILFALVATALMVGGNAFSSPSTKYYTTSISPPSAAGGSTQQFTVLVHNCGAGDPAPCKPSTQSLGSANVTIPTGAGQFQLPITIVSVAPPTGKTWTASVSGNALQLRNPGPSNSNALAPGESVSVTFTVTTPASCGQQYALTTQTKQSNDFSGTGNDFTRQGSEPSISVSPGALAYFTISSPTPASPTAGSPFGVTVTAYDGCNNIVTTYSGGATFSLSGLDPSPNGTAATYGTNSWSGGVDTVSNIYGYDASSTEHLVAADSAASVSSQGGNFTIQPGLPASSTWTTQPTESAKGANVNGPPSVTVKDAWGNAVGAGFPVTVSLSQVGGSTGTLSGTTTETTNASGVAVFDNLVVSDSGEYQLNDGDGANPLSSVFLVADQVNACHGGNCPKTTGSANNTTTDATATNAGNDSSLAVAVLASETSVPNNVCATAGGFGFFPLGSGSFVNVITSGPPSAANYTITWTLDKSIVNQQPDNSAAHFDICLGAVNVNDPLNLNNTQGWQTKTAGPAVPVFDANLNQVFFWGVMPDCPKKGVPQGPCVQSRHKDNAGDEVVTWFKPAPWDGHYFGGGP